MRTTRGRETQGRPAKMKKVVFLLLPYSSFFFKGEWGRSFAARRRRFWFWWFEFFGFFFVCFCIFVGVFLFSVKNCASGPNFSVIRFDSSEIWKCWLRHTFSNYRTILGLVNRKGPPFGFFKVRIFGVWLTCKRLAGSHSWKTYVVLFWGVFPKAKYDNFWILRSRPYRRLGRRCLLR